MNKRHRAIAIFFALLLVSSFYVMTAFLYSPFSYPKGNAAYRKWYEFRQPISIECLSWSEQGSVTHYKPSIGDRAEAKYIINGFARMQKLEDYDYQRYLDELPDIRGKEYTIIVRQPYSISNSGDVGGEILIQFSFYENTSIAEQDGSAYYQMSDEYKRHILEAYSEEVCVIPAH